MEKSCRNDGKTRHGGPFHNDGVPKFRLEAQKIPFYESSGMVSTYLENGIANLCLQKVPNSSWSKEWFCKRQLRRVTNQKVGARRNFVGVENFREAHCHCSRRILRCSGTKKMQSFGMVFA